MKLALYVISGICWFLFATTALGSKTAIHEIESILFVLIAVIAMSSGYLIGIINVKPAKPEPKPLSNKKPFWKKPGQLS